MFFGALSAFLVPFLTVYLPPAVIEQFPADPEASLTLIFTGIFLYFKNPDKPLTAMLPGGGNALKSLCLVGLAGVLAVGVVGCARDSGGNPLDVMTQIDEAFEGEFDSRGEFIEAVDRELAGVKCAPAFDQVCADIVERLRPRFYAMWDRYAALVSDWERLREKIRSELMRELLEAFG